MAPASPEPSLDEDLATWLLAQCPELGQASRLLVAFSGGLDSTVLLHLLSRLKARQQLAGSLGAVHVHHGLQAMADQWQAHCAAICAALGIPLHSVAVRVDQGTGESPEEAARRSRHAAFSGLLGANECLLLAHHRDDQAETVLQRLLRGSGAGGLSGIPLRRPCGKGHILRPLLPLSRARLIAYARDEQLQWIEDPSNQDTRFERNHLRHVVLPDLRARWPGTDAALARSAQLARETAGLLDDLAAIDLAQCEVAQPNRLRIADLSRLSDARQRNLLRYWLQNLQHAMGFAAPNNRVLQRILSEVVDAAPDGEPCLRWGTGAAVTELRRYRDMLYLLHPMPDVQGPLRWDTRYPLQLPAPLGSLHLQSEQEAGMPDSHSPLLEVCFRQGGEAIRMPGRPGRTLKNFLQENGVPPWLRPCIPLVFSGPSLISVGDLPAADAGPMDAGKIPPRIRWERSDLDCGY